MAISIGDRLRSARESKGVGLEEATLATKVQRKILEAIEANRIEEVLEPAYAKIFLKKYANYLGLDGSAIVREYLAMYGPPPSPLLSVETQVKKESAPGPLQQLWVPAGILVTALIGLSFVGYLAYGLYGNLTHAKEKPKVAARAKSKPLPAVERTAAGPKLIVPRSQPLSLTIRAKADVWMQIKSDGSVIFQNVLRRGEAESWSAREEIEIWTGNAGAMELVLNGKPLSDVGNGVRKGLKVTHEGLKG